MIVGKAVIDRISDLERKLCCKTRYVDELPETGVINTLYVNNTTGVISIWNGTEFVSADLEEITYDNLVSLITSNNLIQGKKYLLTDYRTRHLIPRTIDYHEGPIEPLMLTALSNNKLEPVAYSTLYPQDIIYYTYHNQQAGFDGANRGVILRRIDTKNNNDIGNDFRHIVYRRYKIDLDNIPEWNDSTAYNADAIVKVTSTNLLHFAIRSLGNIGKIPPLNVDPANGYEGSDYWVTLSYNADGYWGINNHLTNTQYLPTNRHIALPLLLNDFQDKTLFPSTNYDKVLNNTITGKGLYNTVFHDASLNIRDNKILCETFTDNNFNNRINGNNIFSRLYRNNLIGTWLEDNTFLAQQNDNIISHRYYHNTHNGYFQNNVMFGRGFNNVLPYYFFSNRAGIGFVANTINGYVFNTNFSQAFQRNNVLNGGDCIKGCNIERNCQNNLFRHIVSCTIGKNFSYNNLTVRVQSCTIGDNFRNNFASAGNIISVDLSSATLVYNTYTKEIFQKPDGTYGLKYIDNTNTQVIANLTD